MCNLVADMVHQLKIRVDQLRLKGAKRLRSRLPRWRGAPGEVQPVPPEKIPAKVRVAALVRAQGEQPKLPGLARGVAAKVCEALNRIRRTDLVVETDCREGCEELYQLAGRVGNAAEHNATSPIAKFDHTMWQIGDEVVDTRPGMWIKHFLEHPEIKAAVDNAVRGLAARLEQGAVMTRAEFERFMGVKRLPRGFKFGDDPFPGSRGRPRGE